MRYFVLAVLLTSCGAPFDAKETSLSWDAGGVNYPEGDATSQVSSGPQTDASVVDTGAEAETGPSDSGGDGKDSDTDSQVTDGSEPLTCPSNACTVYCAQMGMIDNCYEGKCECL